MTRGWAWTALVLILLIPASVVVATTFLIINEANYDPDADTQEEGWIWLIVFIWVFLWSALCAVGALVCAIAGTVRSRQHPERPQAPVVAVVVWVFLAMLATPVLLTIVGGFL